MITTAPWRSAKCPGTSFQPSWPNTNGPPMSSSSAAPHTPTRSAPLVAAATNSSPAPTAVLAARPSTDWRSARSSRLASMNRKMCAARTTAYAQANSSASEPNAPGTHSAATRNAAIATKIIRRTAPSSGSTTLVSHA